MHELIATHHDCDVRNARIGCREKHQVARREIASIDRFALAVLLPHFTRKRDAKLREDVLRKSAAIEAVRIAAAVAIGRASKRQRSTNEGVPVEDTDCGRTFG